MPEDDSDDNNDDHDEHDDEAKYEYIPDFDDDLDGEFVLRLLVNLDSASKHKYLW